MQKTMKVSCCFQREIKEQLIEGMFFECFLARYLLLRRKNQSVTSEDPLLMGDCIDSLEHQKVAQYFLRNKRSVCSVLHRMMQAHS